MTPEYNVYFSVQTSQKYPHDISGFQYIRRWRIFCWLYGNLTGLANKDKKLKIRLQLIINNNIKKNKGHIGLLPHLYILMVGNYCNKYSRRGHSWGGMYTILLKRISAYIGHPSILKICTSRQILVRTGKPDILINSRFFMGLAGQDSRRWGGICRSCEINQLLI
jgi:hypothetical protein